MKTFLNFVFLLAVFVSVNAYGSSEEPSEAPLAPPPHTVTPISHEHQSSALQLREDLDASTGESQLDALPGSLVQYGMFFIRGIESVGYLIPVGTFLWELRPGTGLSRTNTKFKTVLAALALFCTGYLYVINKALNVVPIWYGFALEWAFIVSSSVMVYGFSLPLITRHQRLRQSFTKYGT